MAGQTKEISEVAYGTYRGELENTMAIYKRGKIYWYKFMWNGRLVRESTKQGNDKVARQMESAHRTALAKGEVGIRERKPIPTLGEFIDKRFEPWAKATFGKSSPKTWLDRYRVGLRAIMSYKPIVNLPLDQITGERIAEFAAYRQTMGLQVSTVNSSLRVLRRVLRLAVEWGAISSSPKIKLLRGERHRERVITPEEESRYLAAALEPLASIATVMVDTSLGPDECFRLRWEAITWANGRYGTLMVTYGKTSARRRVLPMTPRVRTLLESMWRAVGKPEEGWVFTAETKSGHAESSTIKKQHQRALRESGVRPFVLYSLRHTFLTRLGVSGCDAWTLARIAGHSNIAISARYVHSSQDAVLAAMARLGGHNSGHTPNEPLVEQDEQKLLTH